MDGTRRSRWVTQVIQSGAISDATRALLLILVVDNHMNPAGYFCVPRHVLAARLNRHPNRVTERIKDAKDAGFLTVVRPGYRGHTSEYQAVTPDQIAHRSAVRIPTPKIGDLSTPESSPDGGCAIDRPVVTEHRSLAHANGWEKYALDERST